MVYIEGGSTNDQQEVKDGKQFAEAMKGLRRTLAGAETQKDIDAMQEQVQAQNRKEHSDDFE